eukprot:4426082-Pyramimonas_sp.AAC.1
MSRNYPKTLRLRKSATVRSPLGRVRTVLGIWLYWFWGNPNPRPTPPLDARVLLKHDGVIHRFPRCARERADEGDPGP